MNEKGFATIFGLCLILVFALVVKGIQAAENNHAHETTNLQAEFELQNAADSALIEVADEVLRDPTILPEKIPYVVNSRKNSQRQFTKTFGKITVDVWGEKINIRSYEVNHSTKIASRIPADIDKPCYVFFSLAQTTIHGVTIYRRAFAYVEVNDTNETIHFTTLKSSNYDFE